MLPLFWSANIRDELYSKKFNQLTLVNPEIAGKKTNKLLWRKMPEMKFRLLLRWI